MWKWCGDVSGDHDCYINSVMLQLTGAIGV